jgi:hypothetical protein
MIGKLVAIVCFTIAVIALLLAAQLPRKYGDKAMGIAFPAMLAGLALLAVALGAIR